MTAVNLDYVKNCFHSSTDRLKNNFEKLNAINKFANRLKQFHLSIENYLVLQRFAT